MPSPRLAHTLRPLRAAHAFAERQTLLILAPPYGCMLDPKLMLTMKNTFLILVALVLGGLSANAQPAPAPAQARPTMIVGATAHIGDGTVIENSAICFNNGQLIYVGEAPNAPKMAFEVIDAKGQHVYPGIIAPNTRLGLVEIEAVRATNDYDEVGAFNPSVRSIIAYNTDSRITPTVRSNGVLVAQTVPSGGWVSGQSSIVELDAWNWEDAAYRTDDGLWMSWPSPYQRMGWWAAPGGLKANDRYDDQVKAIKDFFADAKSYIEGEPSVPNLKFEAMRGLLEGKKRLFIRADYVKAMMHAVDWASSLDVPFVLVGAEDAWQITDYLAEKEVPIMLSRTHRLPNRAHEDIDQPFKTPKALADAGILYCLMYNDAWQVRNLPFQAGQAVAFGLDKEEALRSITLSTAEILGIDDQLGSLEAGKDATLFISSGDALDQLTHQVTAAFIRGRQIDLDNKQKALYEKFKQKYDAQD